ncbi:MAG: hypothetical protein LBM75_02715 [Myxococcales bacterium]|nr:hypothetical protein [Myxococcales bacterium]
MPNNKSDGYLENLLFDALKLEKPELASESEDIVLKFKNKAYPPHHETKAKLAIAMAMLENPGRNISHLIEKDILNHNTNDILGNFISFLKSYFD